MENNTEGQYSFDTSNLLFFLLRYRTLLIGASLAAAVLSAIASFMIQEKFLSTVILFPANTSSISKSLMTEDAGAKNDINAFGEEEQAEQVLQILNSDEIRGKLVAKYNLMEHYEIDQDDQYKLTALIKEWESNVSYKRTEFMSVRIDVLDTDPNMAALIANDIAAELDSAKNRMQQERAQGGLKIIEEEYFDMLAFMKTMDDSLTTIRKAGVIEYEMQSEMFAQEYYKLLAKGGNNSAALKKMAEEKEVLAQYGSAYLSLTENLEFNREQLALLRAKWEQTKVDANQNLTHKFVVNRAYASEKKAYPIRWLIVVVSTLSTFMLTILIIIGFENYKKFLDYERRRKANASA